MCTCWMHKESLWIYVFLLSTVSHALGLNLILNEILLTAKLFKTMPINCSAQFAKSAQNFLVTGCKGAEPFIEYQIKVKFLCGSYMHCPPIWSHSQIHTLCTDAATRSLHWSRNENVDLAAVIDQQWKWNKALLSHPSKLFSACACWHVAWRFCKHALSEAWQNSTTSINCIITHRDC